MTTPRHPQVFYKSSETMNEVADHSAKLLVGASVYLGDDATWADYLRLYDRVYVQEGLRKLLPDGYFVLIQTDQYKDNACVPRNARLVTHLEASGYTVIDSKVWLRRKADFFQPPFSLVWLMRPAGGTAKRPPGTDKAYLQGVWDYPQTAGGRLNAYPDGLCRLLITALTQPGDLILDPFCGTARLLGLAGLMGRRAVGYEIDRTLKPTIDKNLKPELLG